ncbi:MAG: TlpA disulfide reductase family protein [Thermoguttaceae bacterium]
MWFRSRVFAIGTPLLAAIVLLSAAMTLRTDEPAAAAAEPDPFAVPDGTPAELLALIEQLTGMQPDGTGFDEVRAFEKKVLGAVDVAAGKILAAKPTEEELVVAVNWKMTAMVTLQRFGDQKAAAQLEAFPAMLAHAGHKEIARQVKAFLLERQLTQAMMDRPERLGQLIGQIKEFLGESPIGRAEVGLVMGATQSLERVGNTKLAAEAYRDFGKLLGASDVPEIAAIGAKMEGAARRIDLVGKPMHLEGTFLDGTAFDWAAYKEKTVLVQFWATWCGPCLQEIPNIRRNWDLYHDQGFEVVAVNCDDSRAPLEAFLKQNELPWKQLFSEDPDAMGMDNPMATHYGVMGIPTLILVGPDGKVVSLDARGPELAMHLEKLLGPANGPTADKPTTEKPTAGT